jgi:two-component system response regulator FlrC
VTRKDLRILLVEDDTDLRDALVSWLQEEWPNVYQAGNGKEALVVLKKEKIDFVVSDIKMPLMDGMELLSAIRSSDPQIPVVLLTTGESAITEAMAINAGAIGLIPKPFPIEALIEKINSALNKAA